MDKNHGALYQHIETTKVSAIFCCKQDYNEGYCQDGATHGENENDKIEMICSPSSFNPSKSGSFANVISIDMRNHQMYSYCPAISQAKCGFPDGTNSKDMVLKATKEKN